MKTTTKVISLCTLLAILALTGFVYFKYFFVFAEGVKAGELNQFALKGYIFKTYEGKIIQAGIRGGNAANGALIESYNLEFSVKNPEIAQALMGLGGQLVQVHYKQYKGVIPWRGNTKYIVDKIISATEAETSNPIEDLGKVQNR